MILQKMNKNNKLLLFLTLTIFLSTRTFAQGQFSPGKATQCVERAYLELNLYAGIISKYDGSSIEINTIKEGLLECFDKDCIVEMDIYRLIGQKENTSQQQPIEYYLHKLEEIAKDREVHFVMIGKPMVLYNQEIIATIKVTSTSNSYCCKAKVGLNEEYKVRYMKFVEYEEANNIRPKTEIKYVYIDRSVDKSEYCQAGKNRYVAWGIVGIGYPLSLSTNLEGRIGKDIGVGLYGEIGASWTLIDYSWQRENTSNRYFSYAYGIKFYPFRGLYIDCGYGTIAKSYVDLRDVKMGQSEAERLVDNGLGVLFHVGYNFVGDLEDYKSNYYIGVSTGMSYDVKNNVFAPSMGIRFGIAWGTK